MNSYARARGGFLFSFKSGIGSSISAILAALILFQTPFSYGAADQTVYEGLFGKSKQIRELGNCGVYLAPKGADGTTDNSSGYKLATMDYAHPEKTLNELKANLWQLMAEGGGYDAADGDLAVTGLPLWDQFSKDFQIEVAKVLEELGIDSRSLNIIPMYVSKGKGLKGLAEKARMLLPMAQNYEKPISQETTEGVIGVVGSEVTTATYALSHFSLKASIPMLLGHFGGLVGLTAWIRTVINWQNSSRSKAAKFFKQSITSAFFVLNYNLTSQWPQIAQAYHSGTLTLASSWQAIKDFGHGNGGLTTLIQTTFFWATFANGIYRWAGMRSQDPATSQRARRATAILTPAIFWITGPLLAKASTSTDIIARFSIPYLGSFSINPGQVELAAAALVGSIFWWKPTLLDPIAEWTDKYIYPVLNGIKNQVKAFGNLIGIGGSGTPPAPPASGP